MIKLNNKKIEYSHFPDGSLNVKAMTDLLKANRILISWNYENNEEFFVIAFLAEYYKANGKIVDLYCPYVPNGRMDRVENVEDVFTLKYFGKLINNIGFDKVFVLSDYHSSVTPAVINNINILSVSMLDEDFYNIVDVLSDDETLMFYPDEGAMKRYSKNTNIPYAFGVKKRDWKTGNIIGLDVVNSELVKGKNILIRDDICSKGGTFFHAAKKLKELGANKIYLQVSHLEKSVFAGEFGENKCNLLDTGLIEFIMTTNSIINDDNIPDEYADKILIANIDIEVYHVEDNENDSTTEKE